MKNFILKISLITIIFSLNSFAQGPGDGTLPILRSIRMKFIDGELVKLPITINVDVQEKLIANKLIKKEVEIAAIGFKQTLKIMKKDNGQIKLDTDHFLHEKLLRGEMFALNEFEFVNEINIYQNKVIQEILLDIK